MWEYKITYKDGEDWMREKMFAYLNHEGNHKWELVHVITRFMVGSHTDIANYSFIWKRKKGKS